MEGNVPKLGELRLRENLRVSARRRRIHWGWVPAAIFFFVTAWIRLGWWIALAAAAAGLGVAYYAEWKARKRRQRAAQP
jgi:CHASE2 domain-containing sensor protein